MPTNEQAESARRAVAARQLATASRPERDLCTAVLAPEWSSTAPRCHEVATVYVCLDTYRSGMTTGGVFTPAEKTAYLCDGHAEQVRREPGFRWSRPLANEGS